MGPKKNPTEAQFDDDLQKAMALSLESHAMEEMKKTVERRGGKIFHYSPA